MAIVKEVIGDCEIILEDALVGLGYAAQKHQQRNLSILTDPPYGIRADEAAAKKNGKWGWKQRRQTAWDRERPDREYFDRMRQVSCEQIIWGGNYFSDLLPPKMRWLMWDKGQRDFSLADFEMAWTSHDKAARIFDYPRALALKDGKEHPTQKPVALMEWCIGFLKPATTILDCYLGSGTTLVACAKLGRKGIGIEVDEDYFNIACERVEDAYRQGDLFIEQDRKQAVPEQMSLLRGDL